MAKQVRRVRRKRRHDRHVPVLKSKGRLAIYLAALLAGFMVGFLLLSYAPRAYSGWRESRLLKRATERLEQQDLEGAMKAAQQMLQIRPDSVAAFQILADTTEKQNRAETVAWRAQIARLLPDDLDSQLNLASAALRFGQLDTARRALENVAPQDRDKAAYHVVAGWLEKAQGNEKDVEAHFAAALQQEPENELYQYNLAVLQVRLNDPEKYPVARETLERLRKVPGFRTGSLRALLSDALERDELERADSLAQELQLSQQVTFGDYLLCLDFYQKLDQKKFSAVLDKVKPVAAKHPPDVAALMDWMNKHGLAAEVLRWMDKLPSEIATNPPAAIAIAEAFAEMKNWSRLKRWTRSGAWGDSEFLRLAFQAYSSRQARQSAADAEFDSLWSSAERSASERPEREAALARLAMKWNLPIEAEQLWQRVAKHPPMRREALDALFRIYRGNNDLRRLLQVSKQLHESSPREPGLTSNYARLALILEPNTEEAQRKAREAYDSAPIDAHCVVTYAFALYGLGRTAEGLEVLAKLPPEQLLDPHSAVYAAVLFLDLNQPERAKEYIDAAKEGPLHPEEQDLLDEALTRIAAPSPSATPAITEPSPPAQPEPPAATPALPPTPPHS